MKFFAASGFPGYQNRSSRARSLISSFRQTVCTTRFRFLGRSTQSIKRTKAVFARLTPLASPQGKPEPPEFWTFVENTVHFIRKYQQELPVTESTSVIWKEIHNELDILTKKALERPGLHDMQKLAERWVVLTNKMKEALELNNLKRPATAEAELKALKRLRAAAEEAIQKSCP